MKGDTISVGIEVGGLLVPTEIKAEHAGHSVRFNRAVRDNQLEVEVVNGVGKVVQTYFFRLDAVVMFRELPFQYVAPTKAKKKVAA